MIQKHNTIYLLKIIVYKLCTAKYYLAIEKEQLLSVNPQSYPSPFDSVQNGENKKNSV